MKHSLTMMPGRTERRKGKGVKATGRSPHSDETDIAIGIEDVTRYFFKDNSQIFALSHISVQIPRGKIVAILGPSGCGKSTLLNIVAGLDKPDEGGVKHHGEPMKGPAAGTGYMTQHDTLLPWRTIEENLLLPLELQARNSKGGPALSKRERKERVQWALDLVRLSDFGGHLPSEVSGGMSKRASLARMLVYSQDTLLLDEPFSALDAQTRTEMHQELLDICDHEHRTVLLVTHDIEEAICLADEIVILSARPGRIKETVQVPIPRPRDPVNVRFENQFQDLFTQIWADVHPASEDAHQQVMERKEQP